MSGSQGLRLGLLTVATSVAKDCQASLEATVTSQGHQPPEQKRIGCIPLGLGVPGPSPLPFQGKSGSSRRAPLVRERVYWSRLTPWAIDCRRGWGYNMAPPNAVLVQAKTHTGERVQRSLKTEMEHMA